MSCFGNHPIDRWLERQVDEYNSISTLEDRGLYLLILIELSSDDKIYRFEIATNEDNSVELAKEHLESKRIDDDIDSLDLCTYKEIGESEEEGVIDFEIIKL